MKNINILYINLGKELEILDTLKKNIEFALDNKSINGLSIMVAKSNLKGQMNKIKSIAEELEIDINKINFDDYNELLEILEKRSKLY